MLKLLCKGLRVSPAAVGAALLLCNSSVAQTLQEVSAIETEAADPTSEILQQVEEYNPVDLSQGGNDPLDRVNFVNQLRDVKPTDWAYTALQNLAQRHQCLLAYPDGTYRGNRAMTRYEFAAGLDACLEQIQRQLATLDTGVSGRDLETLRRLQEEFAGELTILRRQVDAIEVRTAELEANQFSTTTKLKGEAIFALVDAFGDQDAGSTISGGEDVETSFGYRARLTFDTSFTGKDRLRTRLQARDIARLDRATGTAMTRLGFDGENGTTVTLHRVDYRFPLSDTVRMNIGAHGFDSTRFVPVLNPLFESSGGGALSRFGRRNPAIHRTPSGGAGVGFEIKPSKQFRVDLGYFSDNDSDSPTSKNGLFNGPYSALGQITVSPTENLDVALSYINSYAPGDEVNVSGTTGSTLARRPFGRVATSANHFGLQTSIDLSPVTISAWGGYVSAQAESGANEGDKADIWNWMVSLGVDDIGMKGGRLGFIFGMPPKLTDIDNGTSDSSTSLHFETLYRFKITKKIEMTPGFIVITNPNHNEANNTVWVGTLRTRFKF